MDLYMWLSALLCHPLGHVHPYGYELPLKVWHFGG